MGGEWKGRGDLFSAPLASLGGATHDEKHRQGREERKTNRVLRGRGVSSKRGYADGKVQNDTLELMI